MMYLHFPPFRLREFKIEVTYRCPLACIHCSSDASPSSSHEMSKKDCLQIIIDAVDMKAKEIALSGGEPLLWPPLDEAIDLAINHGLQVSIYTSGNVPYVQNRMKNLSKLGVDSCIFSIFGSNQTKHEHITRIRGSFLGTKMAIDAANKYGMRTEFHFVPLINNYKELESIALLSKEWGVSRISVLRFVPQGRGFLIQNQILSSIQNIQLKKAIERLRSQGFNIRTGSPYNFLLLNDQPKCSSGVDRIIIGPDLRIYSCDAFKQIKAEEVVGTLELSCLKANNLKECWEGSPFLLKVREYLTTEFVEPCSKCNVLERCLSGCLAQKVIINKNFKKCPDPMCLRS